KHERADPLKSAEFSNEDICQGAYHVTGTQQPRTFTLSEVVRMGQIAQIQSPVIKQRAEVLIATLKLQAATATLTATQDVASAENLLLQERAKGRPEDFARSLVTAAKSKLESGPGVAG